MADKKLVVTTLSSREKGTRRREEGETASSQRAISLQGNQEESRNNLMKVDDDSPTHTRNIRNNNNDETKRMEDLRGKGGRRLKHRTVDGDVPLCLRKNQTDSNDVSSSKRKTREEKESGSSILGKTKHCFMNKMASGSEGTCPRSIDNKDEHPKNKEVTFIILQKNVRSMHSSEKIEELVTELEGYRWDAVLLNETWRDEPAELWETCHKHIIMGAGKYDNKHGVGIMHTRWRKRIIDTEYINERAITTTVLVNRQHIKLMSVYFPHSKYADHHIEKMYKTIEKHMLNNKNTFQSLEETSMLSWDLVKERNVKVLASTL